jgi:hypothetical protein
MAWERQARRRAETEMAGDRGDFSIGFGEGLQGEARSLREQRPVQADIVFKVKLTV